MNSEFSEGITEWITDLLTYGIKYFIDPSLFV
jgi:hypothetical protein